MKFELLFILITLFFAANTYYDGKYSLKEMIYVPSVTKIFHSRNSSQNIHTYSSLLNCLKVFFDFGKGIKLGPN